MSVVTKGMVDGTMLVTRGYGGGIFEYLIKRYFKSYITLRKIFCSKVPEEC